MTEGEFLKEKAARFRGLLVGLVAGIAVGIFFAVLLSGCSGSTSFVERNKAYANCVERGGDPTKC